MTTDHTPAKIRPLSAADLENVIAIDMATTGISRRGYFEKRLTAATDRPKDYVYVGVQADNQLLGFAFAKLVNGEFGQPGASASLDALGVDPKHGQKGYGHQLLNAVKDVLASKGVETLTSQVDWSDSVLLAFFGGSGFELAPRLVLSRSTEEMQKRIDEDQSEIWDDEPDYSSPDGDDPDALSLDRIPVRSMKQDDLRKIISIDRESTGVDRSEYYERKLHESLHETGVRVSLVAEIDGYPVGFIMAGVDFGEFGHTSTEAGMDTLAVDPGFQGQGIGRALMAQLIASLAILQVDTVYTEINWNDVDLIAYLSTCDFAPTQRVTLVRKLQ